MSAIFCPRCDRRLTPDHCCLSRRIFLFAGLGGLFAPKAQQLYITVYGLRIPVTVFPGQFDCLDPVRWTTAKPEGLRYFDPNPIRSSGPLTSEHFREAYKTIHELRTP